jgi:hypothetical protein
MRSKIQGRLMEARFIKIHQVFAKKKKFRYFSKSYNAGDTSVAVPENLKFLEFS